MCAICAGCTARIVPNHSAFRKRNQLEPEKRPLRLFEIARVLVRVNHVARVVANANHSIVLPTAKLRVVDCIIDGVWLAIPQPTEWQRIGNKIGSAMIRGLQNWLD